MRYFVTIIIRSSGNFLKMHHLSSSLDILSTYRVMYQLFQTCLKRIIFNN